MFDGPESCRDSPKVYLARGTVHHNKKDFKILDSLLNCAIIKQHDCLQLVEQLQHCRLSPEGAVSAKWEDCGHDFSIHSQAEQQADNFPETISKLVRELSRFIVR